MNIDYPSGRNGKRPIDGPTLEAMALRYVERYATSREKLARYLWRKLRERGWGGDSEPPVAALVEKLATLRYVDDRQFAESRTRSLAGRGYGARRIGQALAADGIAPTLRAELAEDVDELAAAMRLAKRRKIGPFAEIEPTPDMRRKSIGILMRAGHSIDLARRVAGARTVEELTNEA